MTIHIWMTIIYDLNNIKNVFINRLTLLKFIAKLHQTKTQFKTQIL